MEKYHFFSGIAMRRKKKILQWHVLTYTNTQGKVKLIGKL